MELLAAVVLPSNLVLVIGFLGTVLWLLPRWRRAAPYVLTAAWLLLLVVSSGKTATALSSPLEYAYVQAPAPQADSPAKAIVVLAAYAADDPNMPLSSRLNDSAMFRIVEAVHLWRACQQCTVTITGRNPTVKVMAESLGALGVPGAQIRLDAEAGNTAASAVNARATLGEQALYLVTSAGHMPRAMGVFLKQGLRPIPAPTDYHVPKYVAQANWSPSALNLNFSDFAVHEYVGMLWYRITGRI